MGQYILEIGIFSARSCDGPTGLLGSPMRHAAEKGGESSPSRGWLSESKLIAVPVVSVGLIN